MRLDPPPGTQVAAPGVLGAGGVRRLQHGRDFSFAAGRLRSKAATIDGVRVTVWAVRSRHRSGLDRVLRIARTRLPRLAARFGPYGWPDLQIVINRDAAMEHTGLIMSPPQDFVVTHELAHEWWYALISDDQALAPWLDEGFASYAEEAAGSQQRPWCRHPRRGAGLVTKPVDFFRGRRIVGLRLRLHGGRLPARRAAQADGRRAVRRRPARLRARAPLRLVDRLPPSARRWTPPRRCRSATSGRATACPDPRRPSPRPACSARPGRRARPAPTARSCRAASCCACAPSRRRTRRAGRPARRS